jgi:hypothetical protein
VAPRKTRELETGLTAKGFRKDDTHHEMYWFFLAGRKTSVRTRISHSTKEYGDHLLGQMARQVRLQRGEFDDLVECPLSGTEYAQLLIDRGHVRSGE